MKKGFSFLLILTLCALLFQVSCGSGGSSSNNNNNNDDETVVIENLEDLPNLALTGTAVDPAGQINAVAGLSRVKRAVGDLSGPGCMAVEYFRPQSILRLEQAQSLSCYVQQTQSGAQADADTANNIEVPTGSFGYYSILVPMTNDETGTVHVRVGNFSTADGNTLKLDVCDDDGNGNFSKTFEYRITGNLADKTWSGHVTNYPSGGEQFLHFDFDVVMASAAAMQTTFDFANVPSSSCTLVCAIV